MGIIIFTNKFLRIAKTNQLNRGICNPNNDAKAIQLKILFPIA